MFYDEKGAKVEEVFLRAPDTSAVAPQSSAEATPSITVLQNDVKVLASRIDAIERNQNSLSEMIEWVVKRAVAVAFAERWT